MKQRLINWRSFPEEKPTMGTTALCSPLLPGYLLSGLEWFSGIYLNGEWYQRMGDGILKMRNVRSYILCTDLLKTEKRKVRNKKSRT